MRTFNGAMHERRVILTPPLIALRGFARAIRGAGGGEGLWRISADRRFLGGRFRNGVRRVGAVAIAKGAVAARVPGSPFRGSDEPRQEIESHRAVEGLC